MSIFSRRRRDENGILEKPRISAISSTPVRAAAVAGAGKPARAPVAYPDRPMSLDGARRDRWLRDLVGSIVDRTAPVLLDRRDVELALDLSPAAFDRRMRDGKLGLQDCVMQVGRDGPRELYRREEVRAELLREVGAAAHGAPMGRSAQ